MVRSAIEIFILGANFHSSCFSVAVIKYYDQEQRKKERIHFGIWHQRDKLRFGGDGRLGSSQGKHGGRSKKLTGHIFIHTR